MKFSLALLLPLLFPLRGGASEVPAPSVPDPIPTEERRTMLAGFNEDLAACDAALAKDPGSISQWSRRGDAHLFLGQTPEAVADFEKMIALDSAQDAPHWRLGIAYYFAGQFEKSARQFTKYHAHDGRDRENGIWRFLAQAKSDGLEQARSEMLAYSRFDREPFPSLYEMFAGRTTPVDLFAEIAQKGLDADGNVFFFSRYYAGLHEELLGHPAEALRLLGQAVASPKAHSAAAYMWQIARLHWDRIHAAAAPASGPAN